MKIAVQGLVRELLYRDVLGHVALPRAPGVLLMGPDTLNTARLNLATRAPVLCFRRVANLAVDSADPFPPLRVGSTVRPRLPRRCRNHSNRNEERQEEERGKEQNPLKSFERVYNLKRPLTTFIVHRFLFHFIQFLFLTWPKWNSRSNKGVFFVGC